ncbi:MAG TPA: VWA domain-containing protein [Anaeromyxobacteraceae bacterium]|nr:VWA domain-containing protein [Anaeromyxobacteraceae bacterium]
MPEVIPIAWAHPWALALLPLALAPLVAHRASRRAAARLRFPGAALLARGPRGVAARLSWVAPTVLALALALGVVAMARPQSRELRAVDDPSEGIDIVLALDLSTSMRAADFRPRDRLHVAKEVLAEFVASRPRDRIGLVVFARQAWIQAPPTRDGELVRALIARLEAGSIEDGTAIGDALATSVNRLRESEARSKVVVLVTDGDDNASHVSPVDAARAAAALGVKVFTVLVGRGGSVPYPVDVDASGRPTYQQVELPVNPALLRTISAATGAAHYDAVDRDSLRRGLGDILDRLERTRLDAPTAVRRRVEHGPDLLVLTVALAAVALALTATRLRSFP